MCGGGGGGFGTPPEEFKMPSRSPEREAPRRVEASVLKRRRNQQTKARREKVQRSNFSGQRNLGPLEVTTNSAIEY